jgi:glycosyltransferase involved in cell wall biosynthesis
MQILMLTASLPYPPHQGGALRSYGILHGLHDAGHEITLLSFHDMAGSSMSVESTPLGKYCVRIETVDPPHRSKTDRLRDLFLSRQPDIAQRLYSDNFLNCLRQLIAEKSFDLIQFEGIEVAQYLLLLREQGIRAKLCYDAFNAEAALQEVIFRVDRGEVRRWPAALYSLIQSRRIARFERDICQQADSVIAVSNEDAEILRQYRSDRHVPVVTNGIFAEDYTTPAEQLDLGEHVLVFTGKMDYRPNVDAMIWFTGNVLPAIQENLPDTKLYIVGQKPHARLEQLRHKNNVEITGWVRDVQPFLRGAGVYVAPLRMGSGTRLKLLEAMASGCAVVATKIAISGMRADAQKAINVVDDAEDMAQEITELLQNPKQRSELGEAARTYVKQHYDWSVLIPNLLNIYQELDLE